MDSGYYVINNTKKVLYWDEFEEIWMKPEKDVQKRFTYLSHLTKQPVIKTLIPVEDTEFASLYKR